MGLSTPTFANGWSWRASSGFIAGLSMVVLAQLVKVLFLGGITGEQGFTGIMSAAYNLPPALSFL